MSKEIGRKLKQLRKEKGFTQQIAAEKLGITRSTISNYEIGRRSPHLTDLQKIAELYGAGLEMFGVVQTDLSFIHNGNTAVTLFNLCINNKRRKNKHK